MAIARARGSTTSTHQTTGLDRVRTRKASTPVNETRDKLCTSAGAASVPARKRLARFNRLQAWTGLTPSPALPMIEAGA